MSRGDLQEMEVKEQSQTAVNANAAKGDPMPKLKMSKKWSLKHLSKKK